MGYVENQVDKLADAFVRESEKTRLALEEGFRGSLRGQRLTGALPRPVQGNAVTYSAGGRLLGWSVLATGGPVRFVLHDGIDTTGDVLAIIDLVDSENETVWFGPGGVSFSVGLYLEQIGTGVPTGTMFIGPVVLI